MNAFLKSKFYLISIIVSKIILVINPFIIAKVIIPKTGNGILLNWKNNIVPKSPIEHPSKHHAVFFALLLHVCLHDQLKDKLSELTENYFKFTLATIPI